MASASVSDRTAGLSGRLFAPGASASVPATLVASGKVALLQTGNSEPRSVSVTAVSDRVGSIPRRLTLSDGSIFECPDGPDVEVLLGRKAAAGPIFYRLEHSWRAAAIAVAAAVLIIAGLTRYGLPAAAWTAARYTPAAYLETIDAGTMGAADATMLESSRLSPERRAELTAIFQELAARTHDLRQPVRLEFRTGAIGPNAFALPGGTIVLLDGLVALAKSNDEIAGVLAHEIGHVAHQHSMQSLYRALGIIAIASTISGDGGQLIDAAVTQLSALQTLSYSRAFETEADRYSVIVMRRAGRDPVAFVALLERIGKSMGGDTADGNDRDAMGKGGWWSSHPGNEDRRRDVDAFAREPLPAP
jgi:Zn-dependent protease with chaperone function